MYLSDAIRHFLKDERATLSVEAVIIFPILLWAYAGMYVFWDAFKMQNINVKSAYTISDMISRQMTNVTAADMDGFAKMLDFLNKGKYDTRLRVSVVRAEEDPITGETELELSWSEARGNGMNEHGTIQDLEQGIPVMAPDSIVIVVETEMDYTPILPAPYGLNPRTFTNFIVTRPRFPTGGQLNYDGAGT